MPACLSRLGGPVVAAALLLGAGPVRPRLQAVTPATAVGGVLTVTATGEGFDAGTGLEVRRPDGRVVATATITERSPTRLVATLPLAGVGPGTYRVSVTHSGRERSNEVALTLVDQVTVTPRSGRPGTLFTYAGRGFTARLGAVSHLQGPTPVAFQSKRIATSAEGTFEQQIDSAEFRPGTYSVWAVDDDTKVPAPAATFEIVGLPPNVKPPSE